MPEREVVGRIECTLPDEVGREALRGTEEMRAELDRLAALPREECGCERLLLEEERRRWICSGMCRTHGVRAGERVAVAVPAVPWTDQDDRVAAPWPGEKTIGVAQADARPGTLVDVVTDDRPSDIVREMFRVARRPRTPG